MFEPEISRSSVPVHGVDRCFPAYDYIRYSFDLTAFPIYLKTKVADHVSITITQTPTSSSDLMGLFTSLNSSETWMFAQLHPDATGTKTDSDDFYSSVHEAFKANSELMTYIGFTRFGALPYSQPLTLAAIYRKYGRGLYKDGHFLPTPWPSLISKYSQNIRQIDI